MVSSHQAFPLFSKVTSFLLNRMFVFSHLMKISSWLQISGTYQDLSKSDHHLQAVPTQSGWEESQKRNVERIFNREIWCKVGAICILSTKKNQVNWCYWNIFWVRCLTQHGPALYNLHKLGWSTWRLQVQLTGSITSVWAPQVTLASHPCWPFVSAWNLGAFGNVWVKEFLDFIALSHGVRVCFFHWAVTQGGLNPFSKKDVMYWLSLITLFKNPELLDLPSFGKEGGWRNLASD